MFVENAVRLGFSPAAELADANVGGGSDPYRTIDPLRTKKDPYGWALVQPLSPLMCILAEGVNPLRTKKTPYGWANCSL